MSGLLGLADETGHMRNSYVDGGGAQEEVKVEEEDVDIDEDGETVEL